MYGCVKGGFWRVAEGSEGVGLWTLVPNSCMLQEGPGGKELGDWWTKSWRELVETDVL